MDPSSVSAGRDGWGEPLPEEASDSPGVARRTRRRKLVLAVGLLVAGVVVFGVVRAGFISSLSTSCREASQAKDWPRLERLAGDWRTWAPGRAAPLIYLAEAANQRGEHERAVELLDQLPDSDPLTPPALLERSGIQFGPLIRPIEGAETLERAIKLDPAFVEARRRLVYFYAFTLQRRKMVEQARDAIRHDCDLPETYVYLMLQDSLSFANAYDETTRWFRGDREEELFLVARAIHRITSRGLDETEDPREGPRGQDGTPFHRQVVAGYFAEFPKNLELLAYYLQLSSTAGDVAEVERLLGRAPPAAVDDHRFWRHKGWLHAVRNELAEAKQSYEKALELNCYDFVARHQLADAERRFKRLDRVHSLEELANEGRSLRRDLLSVPSVTKVTPELLQRIAQYARKCGDDLVAGKLFLRLQQRSEAWLGRPGGRPGSS